MQQEIPDPFFFRNGTGPLPMWMLREYEAWIMPTLKQRWLPAEKSVEPILIPGKLPGDDPTREPFKFKRQPPIARVSDLRHLGDYILAAMVPRSQLVVVYDEGTEFELYAYGPLRAEKETRPYNYKVTEGIAFVHHLKRFNSHLMELFEQRRKPVQTFESKPYPF